jgi:Fic family protein
MEKTPQIQTSSQTPNAQSPTDSLRHEFFNRVLSTIQTPMELLPILEKVFPECDTLSETLAQLDDLKKCLDSFRPLNEAQLRNLLEAWDIKYTYESNRIEGNSLTLRETQLVVAKRMTLKNKTIEEHLEARNHQEAIYYIRDLAAKDTVLSEYLINSIHNIVLGGIDPHNAGKYRSVDVEITGASHVPPQPYLVKKHMEDIFIWYNENKDSIHPVLLASNMHEKIVTVHPWVDGNGRTCRLIMNLILMQHGFPIARISGDDEAREQYYMGLDTAQTQNTSEPFQRIIASYVRKSLFEFLAMVSGNISEEAKNTGAYFFEKMKSA